MDPKPEHRTMIREEQHVGVGRGNRQMLDEVRFDAGRAQDTLAATALRAVGGGRHPLDVPTMGERHHDILFRNEVLFVELDRALEVELGTTRVAILLLELTELVLDQQHDLGFMGEEVLEIGDPFDHLLVFLHHLVALEPGQPS